MEVQVDRKKLIEARYANGLSMLQLAKRAGVSHLTVSNIEKGVKVPAPSTIKKICDVLGIRVEDVLKMGDCA
jgi:transcriptional regulator with XRE-family HTH domain